MGRMENIIRVVIVAGGVMSCLVGIILTGLMENWIAMVWAITTLISYSVAMALLIHRR